MWAGRLGREVLEPNSDPPSKSFSFDFKCFTALKGTTASFLAVFNHNGFPVFNFILYLESKFVNIQNIGRLLTMYLLLKIILWVILIILSSDHYVINNVRIIRKPLI
jgi:hypothetical protein